jgi:hypothetical protein
MLVREFVKRVYEFGRLHAVAMQHGLYRVQPLFDAGHRCGVGAHVKTFLE